MEGRAVERGGSAPARVATPGVAPRVQRRPLAFLCPRVVELRRPGLWRRALAIAAGAPLCLLGVLLIPTPLPGAVPFTAGLAMLSAHCRPARRLAIRIQWTARRARLAREARAGLIAGAGPIPGVGAGAPTVRVAGLELPVLGPTEPLPGPRRRAAVDVEVHAAVEVETRPADRAAVEDPPPVRPGHAVETELGAR